MGWLKRLLTGEPVAVEPPMSYDTPWDAVQAFIHDPQWQVEVLEQHEGRYTVRYDGVVGELLDDPQDEWLHMRFRDPFSEQQKQDELAMYVGWTHHCAQHTLFRWDIDLERQEYYGDAFALFEPQHDAIECIRLAFNSAKLLSQERNRIAFGRRYDAFVQNKAWSSVIGSLWAWMESPLALPGTKIEHASYRETSYWMGSTIGSAKAEQWLYYAVLRFGANDFMPYMQRGEAEQLMLYKMHLGIQRWFPRIRNFVIMTPDQPVTNGTQETSMAILASSGTQMEAIFERCVKEAYEALREYTEWFHYDFNEQTAPWFDHTVKTSQAGYTRDFAPRPVPEM